VTSTLERPAGVYARQSQAKKTSVADQTRLGRAHCESEAWPVHRVYSDLVSASPYGTKPRDDWAELVADVAANRLGVIVMWDGSRGDRTLESWAGFLRQCKDTGTLIYSLFTERLYDPRKPRDWKDLATEGVESQFESEKKSVDVRRGIAGAALAGKQHARSAYGFTRRYNPDDRKDFTEVPNDKIVHAVEIIERVAKEDPLITIAEDLNTRGISAPGGGEWTRKSLRKIAQNHAYIGMRAHRGEYHKAAWEPVVDEDVFWRAQAVLGSPDRRRAAPGAAKYLLSHSVFVTAIPGKRGHVMQGMKGTDGRSPRYRCEADGCTGIDMKAADDHVIALVLDRLSRKDVRDLFERGDADLRKARADLAKLEKRVEEARQAYDDDVIDAESLGRKLKRLKPQVEAAQQRVSQHTSASALLALLGDDEFTEETARPRWAALSLAARRSVVKALFEEIRLGSNTRKLTRWHTDMDRREEAANRIKVTWKKPL
jgi:site-specific DNA recombinase